MSAPKKATKTKTTTKAKKAPAKKKEVAPAKKTVLKKKEAPAKKKAPAKVSKKEEKKMSVTKYVRSLLVQKKYTDADLLSMILKEYSDKTEKQRKVYISVQRGELNSGRKKDFTFSGKIERIVK